MIVIDTKLDLVLCVWGFLMILHFLSGFDPIALLIGLILIITGSNIKFELNFENDEEIDNFIHAIG